MINVHILISMNCVMIPMLYALEIQLECIKIYDIQLHDLHTI
jgi:hypothetical protein